jgi:hypothetical protein
MEKPGMKTREFKSRAAANRFLNLMRVHGVTVRILEGRGLMRGRWFAHWSED